MTKKLDKLVYEQNESINKETELTKRDQTNSGYKNYNK